MGISAESANAFAQNLQTWGGSLPHDQQQVLQAIMEFAVKRVEGAVGGVSSEANDPDAELVAGAQAAIADFAPNASGARPETTPCWTVTTAATVTATSKWLCSKDKKKK